MRSGATSPYFSAGLDSGYLARSAVSVFIPSGSSTPSTDRPAGPAAHHLGFLKRERFGVGVVRLPGQTRTLYRD